MELFKLLENPVYWIIFIIIIIIIATIVARVISKMLNRMERFSDDMTAIYLIRDLITYIIYFFALMIILDTMGIDLTGTLLSLGIVGIAVSLASKDLLSNFFSGVVLIMGKSIKVGDTIEIKDKKGVVERVRLRTTIIVDDNGVKNNVPNSILTNNPYLQYKVSEDNRVDIIAGIGLDIDVEHFKDNIIKIINNYDGISKIPKPNVYSKGITFEETTLKVSFWVKDFNSKDYYKLIITNEIRKYVKGELDE